MQIGPGTTDRFGYGTDTKSPWYGRPHVHGRLDGLVSKNSGIITGGCGPARADRKSHDNDEILNTLGINARSGGLGRVSKSPSQHRTTLTEATGLASSKRNAGDISASMPPTRVRSDGGSSEATPETFACAFLGSCLCEDGRCSEKVRCDAASRIGYRQNQGPILAHYTCLPPVLLTAGSSDCLCIRTAPTRSRRER